MLCLVRTRGVRSVVVLVWVSECLVLTWFLERKLYCFCFTALTSQTLFCEKLAWNAISSGVGDRARRYTVSGVSTFQMMATCSQNPPYSSHAWMMEEVEEDREVITRSKTVWILKCWFCNGNMLFSVPWCQRKCANLHQKSVELEEADGCCTVPVGGCLMLFDGGA